MMIDAKQPRPIRQVRHFRNPDGLGEMIIISAGGIVGMMKEALDLQRSGYAVQLCPTPDEKTGKWVSHMIIAERHS